MKLALCTTTIHKPVLLQLLRACDPDVHFYVATDENTPQDAIDFCNTIDRCSVVTIEHQKQWMIYDHIPMRCIQRRNFATLQALRDGADAIVFWDTDNIPINPGYFYDFESRLQHPHVGLLASPEVEWFDVGAFLDPPSSHRGYPHELAGRRPRLSHCVDVKIGAVAGIVMGNPDVSAVTRIANAPQVLNASPLLQAGIAVDPGHTYTVFNTQNVAVLREFVPAMLLCPQFFRYDDIIGALVCQRIMSNTEHHVLFSTPFVYQERHAHSLTRDLQDEMWGQANLTKVAAVLDGLGLLTHSTTIDKVGSIYVALDDLMPGVAALASAWCQDCERAMG